MMRTSTLLLMTLTALPPAFAAAATATAAEPVQRLQRASGLWKVTPSTSPHSWEICVDHAKDRLIDDDLWADFETECKIASQSRDGDSYRVQASCPDAELAATFKGDLERAYTWSADTSFEVKGKSETQHTELKATFEGACPADLAPGAKKMRGGQVLKGWYHKR